MIATRSLLALSVAALATACASPGGMHPSPPSTGMGSASMPMAAMDPRMKAMKDMHEKMTSAGTPSERQALMADHMKAMQGGMAMMKEGNGGMQGMGGAQGTAPDMAMHHRMMADHMVMMQMMMDMMSDRMPPVPAAR